MSDQTTNDLPASRALCASTPPPETLAQVETGLQKAADRTRRGHITCGLWLLKAHAIHALSPADQRAAARSAKAAKASAGSGGTPAAISGVPVWDARAQPAAEPQSFDEWLESMKEREAIGYSRTSAYRYMQAAVLLGLTHLSSEADVAALPAEKLSAIRIGSGTLALPEPAPEKPATNKGPTARPVEEKARDIWFPFYEELGKITQPDAKDPEFLPFLPLHPDPSDPTVLNLMSLETRLALAHDTVKAAIEAKKKARR